MMLDALAAAAVVQTASFQIYPYQSHTLLKNDAIGVNAGPTLEYVDERARKVVFTESEAFTVVFRDGRTLRSSKLMRRYDLGPVVDTDPATGLKVGWRIATKPGTAYLRKALTLTATTRDLDIAKVVLVDARIPGARTTGTVPGSPVASRTVYVGFEHPRSTSKVDRGVTQCWLDRRVPLRKGQSVSYTAVVGVASDGQLRRAFNRYLESERPRKYSPFLHYNSWYDLGHWGKYAADECVERIRQFGEELVQKRHVKLQSFLFDDGWDEPTTVWEFNAGFPREFAPLYAAARKYDAGPGIWLSPWGGYGRPREMRLEAGKKLGMEIDAQGFALSGPHYYRRFHDFCLKMVRDYGVNQFKFDGTGSPDKQTPGSAFDSDFDAAIQLFRDLRRAQPKLFINLTTGSWPSPFWTRYADSIWRGGADNSFAGVGTARQRWITYRDGDTYHGVVLRGSLYPLSSLMLHGILYARDGGDLKDDSGNDLGDEIDSYFGSGTQLQELYITPTQMTPKQWDRLAIMARWSEKNKDALVDTHWVGGDPMKLEVYGWAAWSPRKAILTLRNPSDKPQAFSIDPRKVFELPKDKSRDFHLTFGAYVPANAQARTLSIPKGRSAVVELKPFEVVVLQENAAL